LARSLAGPSCPAPCALTDRGRRPSLRCEADTRGARCPSSRCRFATPVRRPAACAADVFDRGGGRRAAVSDASAGRARHHCPFLHHRGVHRRGFGGRPSGGWTGVDDANCGSAIAPHRADERGAQLLAGWQLSSCSPSDTRDATAWSRWRCSTRREVLVPSGCSRALGARVTLTICRNICSYGSSTAPLRPGARSSIVDP
jgi:hypothetical protein